ncbi:unnamed protein product [Pylaiella littoralis]
MGFQKLLVKESGLLLLVAALLVPESDACSCFSGRTLCDKVEDATIVLRGTVSNRDEGSSINANTVYEIVTSEIFKGEPDVEYAVDMSFDLVTGGNSALCGIYLEIGDEYLIDLNRYDFGGEESLQAVGLCGLAQLWSTVTEDDQALLRGGCDDYDPCGGTCGDFQECLFYTENNYDATYYCADVCEPERCGDEEVCSLLDVTCVQAPCPPVAVCEPVTPTGGYVYEGCFKDSKDDRVLSKKIDSSSMTTDDCLTHCEEQGAAYMGTQYGRECWCYVTGRWDFDRFSGEEGGAVCDIPCAGNDEEICGGYDAFSLYKMDWPEAPTDDPEYVGCYRDDQNDRVMTDKVTLGDMTPAVCREYCLDRDALYYGTQYSSECWCGRSSGDLAVYTRHGDGVCHFPCSGMEETTCGGYDAFDLFKYSSDE